MEIIKIMNLAKYKNKLLALLGSDAVELLKVSRAFIAGGALTSIFSDKEINDYDIYFRSKKDIVTFLRNALGEHGGDDDNFPLADEDVADITPYAFSCINCTKKSISVSHKGLNLQLIHFDYFKSASDIFKSFDFTINMAAYDFLNEELVIDERFFPDLAQRRLVFNKSTDYPIVSTLRVQKYTERGYKISSKEMMKIGLAVADLELTSWQEVEDQLSGFYGVDVSDFFDRRETFSLSRAIDMLDEVSEKESDDLIYPSFEMLLFYVLGNPHKDQRIFFMHLKDDDGKYTDRHDSSQIFNLNEKVYYKDGLGIETDADEIKSKYMYRHMKDACVGMFEADSDCELSMNSSGLVLKGTVQLISVDNSGKA